MREKKYFFSFSRNLADGKKGMVYDQARNMNLDFFIKESFNQYKSSFRAKLPVDFQTKLKEQLQSKATIENYKSAGLGIRNWKGYFSGKANAVNRTLAVPWTITYGKLALGLIMFFLLPLSIIFINNFSEDNPEPGFGQGTLNKATAIVDMDLMNRQTDCDDSARTRKKMVRHQPLFNGAPGIQLVNNSQGMVYEAEINEDYNNIGYLYLTDVDCARPGEGR